MLIGNRMDGRSEKVREIIGEIGEIGQIGQIGLIGLIARLYLSYKS